MRFKKLGDSLIKISQLLIDVNHEDTKIATASQNLCKLLYYTDNNPLSQPIGKPLNPNFPRPSFTSIKESREYIMNKRISLKPMVPSEEERGAFIIVIADNFFLSENEEFKVNTLIFDIFVHSDNWLLDNNLRPFLIMEQIDTIFNNRKISIGRLKFDSGRTIVLTSQFTGYQLVYTDASIN